MCSAVPKHDTQAAAWKGSKTNLGINQRIKIKEQALDGREALCRVLLLTQDEQLGACFRNRRPWSSSSSSSSSEICQTTGPKPLPKQFLHIVRSRASSFNWQYPLLPLRSFSSFLRLLPRLLVISICPFIFPSITCCRRQFLRKMWPIQLAFRFLISCRIFLCSLTLSNTSSFLTWSVQLIFSILLQHHINLQKYAEFYGQI